MPDPKSPFPKQKFPNTQSSDGLIPNGEAVNFDPEAFDTLLRSQGLTFVHHMAVKCPVGVVDPDDERHPHGDHGDCSNGFLYVLAGPVTCSVSNNSNNPQVLDLGIVNQVNILITPPRFYDVLEPDGSQKRVLLAPYDRLYLSEDTITETQWQLFEPCGGPTDKVDYPIVYVQILVDNLKRHLEEGKDFVVDNGLLRWLPGGRHPPKAPDAGTGGACAIRYQYRPYWYVKDLPHDIRVTQLENPLTGDRSTVRMPQQALLQREYVFENQANDVDAQENQEPQKREVNLKAALGQSNLRQILAPRKGGFGPR